MAKTEKPIEGDEASVDEVSSALESFFAGRVEEALPAEELSEFHDFIRDEASNRRRFAISFRVECGCLAWIGYSLSQLVTHADGVDFKANPMQTYVPDHEPEVEHPEGPTEDPPEQFAEWPIWPYEIYQDELEEALNADADGDAEADEEVEAEGESAAGGES